MELDLKKAEAINCISWILANRLVNENGSPIEFNSHRFLIAPYLDYTPRQVAMKSAQVGWSTLAILKSFHLAQFAGANIIHTFPSRNIAKDFVAPKVDPLILQNKAIRDLIGKDSIYLKQVGDRYIYYRGSFEQQEALSISAHVLINDEFDRSNQKVLKTYRSRLDDVARERPELGWEWQFSNPTVPGKGVDDWWQKSDQKHWFVKCRSGHQQYLVFPDNINFKTKEKVCNKCNKPLSREEIINGEWVPKFNDRQISGYWISQMMVPWITAEKIIEDSEGDPDVFHNFTLGLPFVSKDTSVSRETIIQCLSPGHNPRTNVAIGVDNGVDKTYVVGNRYGIFEIGETKDWEEIENLRNRYNAVMVIDAFPYPHTPRKLVEKYSGKVYIHWYRPDTKRIGIIRWDEEEGVVKSDRTRVIDSVVGDFNAKDITINMTERELEDFIRDWGNLYRIIKPTPQGTFKPRWETIENKPDHYVHATIYWRIALEQTIGGGSITSPKAPQKKGHPEIGPDQTVPSLDLREVIKRITRKRGGWKSI